MKTISLFAVAVAISFAVLRLTMIEPAESQKTVATPSQPPPPAVRELHSIPPPSVDVQTPERPPPESEPAPGEAVIEERARMQRRFDGETVDVGWANGARRELDADLARFASNDVTVDKIECRSTLCRAELGVVNGDTTGEFMEKWVRQRTWTGGGLAVRDGDKLVVFVTKPGVAMVD